MPRYERAFRLSVVALVAFPQLNASAAEQQDRNAVRALMRAATWTVESYLSVFPATFASTPDRIVDDKNVVSWSKVTVKSQAALIDSLSLKFAFYAAYSGYEHELRGVFASPDNEKVYGRYADFKELNLRYDQKAFAVIVGKAPIPVGLATLYSPANRYRVLNTADPMHPDDLGAWQATLDWFLGENTLQFSLLPVEESSPSPHGSSRWLGDSGDNVSSSSSSGTAGGGGATSLTVPPGVSAWTSVRNRLGYLLKFSGVATGVDYFAAIHYGPGAFPTLQNPSDDQFVIETPQAATFSAGAAVTRGALELYGESAYQLADGNDDQDFVRYVIGATYRETALAERLGVDEIKPVVEYGGEWITDHQDNPGRGDASQSARPFRNSLLFKVDAMLNDKITCTVGGTHNFTTHDYANVFGIEYKPNYNLTFRAVGVVFHGSTDSPFGRWDRNDHIEIGVKRVF